MRTQAWRCSSPEQTQTLGVQLGRCLVGGEVIGLVGLVGAGKTFLAQGIALGCGVSEREYVCSPTYTLMNEYSGRFPVFHFDFYRLSDVDELVHADWDEVLSPSSVVLAEWAEMFPEAFPPNWLRIEIKEYAPEQREIRIEIRGNIPIWWGDFRAFRHLGTSSSLGEAG
ncbi:MAG: tRNA (adenosine(37)-N6)-threonylcarbamoyltransferase complex ATPase subunit type 1 TsaE [Myxococcota bacterium]